MRHFIKLYDIVLTSSLWRDDPAVTRVFLTMALMADPNGIVLADAEAIKNKAFIRRWDTFRRAMQRLTSPDPSSRSKECDGARVVDLGNGAWKIVNFELYQSMRGDSWQAREAALKRWQEIKAQKASASSASKPQRRSTKISEDQRRSTKINEDQRRSTKISEVHNRPNNFNEIEYAKRCEVMRSDLRINNASETAQNGTRRGQKANVDPISKGSGLSVLTEKQRSTHKARCIVASPNGDAVISFPYGQEMTPSSVISLQSGHDLTVEPPDQSVTSESPFDIKDQDQLSLLSDSNSNPGSNNNQATDKRPEDQFESGNKQPESNRTTTKQPVNETDRYRCSSTDSLESDQELSDQNPDDLFEIPNKQPESNREVTKQAINETDDQVNKQTDSKGRKQTKRKQRSRKRSRAKGAAATPPPPQDPNNPNAIHDTSEQDNDTTSEPVRHKARVEPTPYQDIVALYHDILVPPLPPIRVITADIKRRMQDRSRDFQALMREGQIGEKPLVDVWRAYFEYIKHCPFLLGQSRNNRDWRASLDWLIRPRNFSKVMSGRYEERRPGLTDWILQHAKAAGKDPVEWLMDDDDQAESPGDDPEDWREALREAVEIERRRKRGGQHEQA